jgi:hypothetical protein
MSDCWKSRLSLYRAIKYAPISDEINLHWLTTITVAGVLPHKEMLLDSWLTFSLSFFDFS